MREHWTNAIKAGDKIPVISSYGGYAMHNVERLTKTQIVLDGGMRLRIGTGSIIGSSTYSRCYAREPTEKIMQEARRDIVNRRIKMRFDRLNIVDLSNENAVRLHLLLVEIG
jgi:hypothetical protein